MKIEVGNYYLNASGEVVKIFGIENDMFLDGSGNGFYEDGKVRRRNKISVFDLIAEIPKELHWWIIHNINYYYRNPSTKNKIEKRFKNRKKEY